MPFLENIKRIATGRTESERKQVAAANIQIRRKALATELREREKQSVRLSTEKVRAKADAKLKTIRSPPRFSMNYGSPFGQPRRQPRQLAPPRTLTPRVKSKKKSKKKKRIYQGPVQQIQQKRWDPIFGGYK